MDGKAYFSNSGHRLCWLDWFCDLARPQQPVQRQYGDWQNMVWRAPKVSANEWGHYQSLYWPVRADCCPRLYAVFMAPADRDAIKLACRVGWVCFDWYFVVFRATKSSRWPRVKTFGQPLVRHKTQKRRGPVGFKRMVLKRFFLGNIAAGVS